VEIEPYLAQAQENLDLCRRISATRGGVLKAENLYGLHRLMLEEKRLEEALRIARRIGGDGLILHRTWVTVLQAGGIRGDLRLNADGTFDLDLVPGTNPDLSILHDMPLRALKAARSNISDLSPLDGMELRQLDISETLVRDIGVLRSMPLETLDLSNTAVTHLAALRGMPLRSLRLDYTGVADITDLAGLSLRCLSLVGSRVQSIAALSQVPLRQLNLAHTKVKELDALRRAPLEDLSLEGTLVTDLTPLTGMPLTLLTLSGTHVVSLEPLRGSPLRELRLAGCLEIETLKPLATCPQLERLVLPRREMDLAPLKNLARLRFVFHQTEKGIEERIAAPVADLGIEGAVTEGAP